MEKAKKLSERLSALETAAPAMVPKGGKSSATRPKRKKAGAEAQVAQARLELDARKGRVAELDACPIELENQLEQRASQVRVAEFKYSCFYDEAQMLKQ